MTRCVSEFFLEGVTLPYSTVPCTVKSAANKCEDDLESELLIGSLGLQ